MSQIMMVPPNKPEQGSIETRTCKVHGDYQSEYHTWGWTACEACIAEYDAAILQKETEAKLSARIKAANIPLRFQQKRFESYSAPSPNQQRALMMCRSYADNFLEQRQLGRCMMMVGKPGTGKTHLALSIGQQVMDAGFKVRYTTVHEAIEEIRSTWRNDSPESESVVLARLSSVDLLILDEVGVQYGKESEQVEIFKFLNKRYNDMLPTIAISNVSVEELKRYLGERAFDRMRENQGRLVMFDWDSERK